MKIGGPDRTSLLNPADLNARSTTRLEDISAIISAVGLKERTFWSGIFKVMSFVAK
jgi:hypothetical protein